MKTPTENQLTKWSLVILTTLASMVTAQHLILENGQSMITNILFIASLSLAIMLTINLIIIQRLGTKQ